LHEILEAGVQHGMREFRADVLADNRRMLDLLTRHTDIVERDTSQGITELVLRPRPHVSEQSA
jgi:hypothetical protein